MTKLNSINRLYNYVLFISLFAVCFIEFALKMHDKLLS